MDSLQTKACKFQNKLCSFCVLFHEKERGGKGKGGKKRGKKGKGKRKKKEKETKEKVVGTDLLIYSLINGQIICWTSTTC